MFNFGITFIDCLDGCEIEFADGALGYYSPQRNDLAFYAATGLLTHTVAYSAGETLDFSAVFHIPSWYTCKHLAWNM